MSALEFIKILVTKEEIVSKMNVLKNSDRNSRQLPLEELIHCTYQWWILGAPYDPKFFAKFGKIICWRPPGGLAPPPTGNPGSTPAYRDVINFPNHPINVLWVQGHFVSDKRVRLNDCDKS